MAVTVNIVTIPIGSQLTSTINKRADPPEPDSKNDFPVLFVFSENATGLTESDITLSAGATLVSLEGANSVWMGWVRPPQTSGIVRVTVAANAVSQGNPRTSKNIRVSTAFPDADAETPAELFTFTDVFLGIATSPSRLLLATRSGSGNNYGINLKKFTYAGVERTSEEISSAVSGQTARYFSRMDYINGDILISPTGSGLGGGAARYTEAGGMLEFVESFSGSFTSVTHSRLGYIGFNGTELSSQSYDSSVAGITYELDAFSRNLSNFPFSIAHQNDLLYLHKGYPFSNGFRGAGFTLAEITESDEIEVITHINIKNSSGSSGFRDIAIYRDTLYLVSSSGTPSVYTIDIRKYRPMAKNTKTTIYPVFANPGDRIDLTQFAPDAERIVFDLGYDKPPYLSINSNNILVIGSSAETCFVKLKAINRIDATETGSFGFYLIVRQATAPVWRNVSELTIRAGGSGYDLFQLVPDAESIAFRSGRTRLAGSRLSNGVFTVGTAGGIAHFTAQKGGQSSHIAIAIDVIQEFGVGNPSHNSGVSGYRVEIEGLDVTADVLEFPSVSETLDPVVINEYRVNEASLTLRNEGGKYNSDLAGNFWETNGLNAGGFQNSVKIWILYSDGRENLHFSGLINESFVPIKGVTFKLNCVDISSRLRKALVQGFGTLEKWDALRKQSDEDSYEGVYVPERSLLPMQVGTGKARRDRTELEISRLELPSEGPAAANTGYMTPNAFRTAGGFLPENPLLRFLAAHRSEDVRFLIHQLAINKEVYNTEIDIPGVSVDTPFLLNRGSIAFSVEQTRTTRLPVDWVHDPTNDRILILLSNPEVHITDLLVQYDMGRDAYRTLHTFEKGVAVHRIERRSGTHYYILTSKKIPQDRSARQLPRPTDSTGYAYDAIAEGSQIKIYHYNSGLQTPPTVLVNSNNNLPPQLGIHYWIGFESHLNIDAFEGIRPEDRGAFKWHANHLYYRYAKDREFGVARVNASGTTAKMIQNATVGSKTVLLCVDEVREEVFLFLESTPNNTTADAFVRFDLPNAIGLPQGMTVDGNDIYLVDSEDDDVYVVSANTANGATATITRRFNLPSGLADPEGVAISGNNLYVVDTDGDEVFVMSKNTANGATATATRRFNLPSGLTNPEGMAISGNNLYVADDAGDEIYVLRANTANGATATTIRRFNLPSDITQPIALTIDGNNLYVADLTDDDVYIVPANTANNTTAKILRQFNLPSGLTRPKGLAFGVLSLALDTPLSYQNHLNFAFDVLTTGAMYFAQTIGTFTDSALILKNRTAGGTQTTVFSDSKGLTELTDLDDAGGTYLGVYECLFHNNYLYLLCAIGRVDVDESTNPPTYSRSRTKAAGTVLYRCNVTAANPSLEVLDKWDFVTHSACGLTVHDGSVHYVEHPPASQRFKSYNPDLETYNSEMGYNVLPESLGALKKINSSGEVEHLGNVWHTDRPYNIAQTRLLSIGDDLHLCVGYGNLDELLRFNSLASGADNMVHIVYGKTLHYVLPSFQPSGSVYAALADIAKKVHATLSFEKNVVMITDRRPYRAVTDGATGTGTADLSFSDTNKPFPSSGYLLIGKEILQYTGISGDTFTGIKRGVLGSTIEDHTDDSEVLYLDNLIESEKLGTPYKAITLQSDTNRIFNIIRDSAGIAEVRDADSIALYGERPYTLELGLTRHEKAWIEEVFASYLAELKDLQHIVNIQVRPDFSLRLGQIVPFFYKDLIRAMRIVSVRYERRATHIKGRTVTV